MAFNIGQMDPFMRVSGNIIGQMGREELFIVMEICMKGIGLKIKLMVRGLTFTKMELYMLVIGLRIYSMDKAWRSGQMDLVMKDDLNMVKRKVMVNLFTLMDPLMRGNS